MFPPGLRTEPATEGKKISNERNSSDAKEIVYYFKIMIDRPQGNRAEGVKIYVCHVPTTTSQKLFR